MLQGSASLADKEAKKAAKAAEKAAKEAAKAARVSIPLAVLQSRGRVQAAGQHQQASGLSPAPWLPDPALCAFLEEPNPLVVDADALLDHHRSAVYWLLGRASCC